MIAKYITYPSNGLKSVARSNGLKSVATKSTANASNGLKSVATTSTEPTALQALNRRFRLAMER